MKTPTGISVKIFCHHYQIQSDFLLALYDYGIIDHAYTREEEFIQEQQLGRIEQALRLHQDLNVNFEGLHIIFELLERLKKVQHRDYTP